MIIKSKNVKYTLVDTTDVRILNVIHCSLTKLLSDASRHGRLTLFGLPPLLPVI